VALPVWAKRVRRSLSEARAETDLYRFFLQISRYEIYWRPMDDPVFALQLAGEGRGAVCPVSLKKR